MHPLLTRWRRTAVLVGTAAATVAALVTVPAAPAQAQPPTCATVAFSASTWSTGPDAGGFAANLILTNTCPATINGWTLELTFAPNHRLSHGWSANWTASGSQITATGLPWNSVLHPGQSTTVGFVGSFSGTYQDPIGCTINGQTCDDGGSGPGENQPPEVTLTRPADGFGLTHPCAVTLAAEASDPDGAIDRVEFFINDVLVGTAQTAPYEIEVPASHPAMSTFEGNVVLARAFDTGSPPASTDSAPATFHYLIAPPALMIIACTTQLELPEGGSEVVTLQNLCASTPQVRMTITGDEGISVSPSSFTLPATGGAQVTISAAPGSALAVATVRAEAEGCLPAAIRVRVTGGGPVENQPPEVTLTRPADGSQFVTSCPVTLSATATDPDGAIDRVEFYLNDVLVGTVDTAPYRIIVPADHPAMSLASPKVAMARAIDNGSPARSADSAPASFGYLPPPPAPWLITCTTRLELAEGDAEVVQFLNICGSAQQVELVVTGDAGVSASPSSFAIPHNARQDVTISAAPGTAGAEAVVQPQGACTSAPLRVTVVEVE